MPQVRIELNHDGIRELLKSEEVVGFLAETASGVQQKCGGGYETDSYMTPDRALASVFTADEGAASDNIENNTLLKAVSG